MLATLVTAILNGLRGEIVRVEVDVAPGLPGCHIVGLPDTALSEARQRVRAAIRNSGFEYPASRITVNLAPADQRKRGAAYDVAIAVGVLLAAGQIRNGGVPGRCSASCRCRVPSSQWQACCRWSPRWRALAIGGSPCRPPTWPRRGWSRASRRSDWKASTMPHG